MRVLTTASRASGLVAAAFVSSTLALSTKRNRHHHHHHHRGLISSSSSTRRTSSIRRLEDGAADDDGYFQYDLSEFSLRFEKCQYVQMFDDDIAEDEDRDSPFALKHFVVFSICPTDACTHGCQSSGGPYGRYVTDVESFLTDTAENQQRYLENMCQTCEEECDNDNDNNNNNNDGGDDDDGFDCSCSDLCDQYENLEDYGYVDASQYTECQRFEANNDDDNNNNNNGDDDEDNGMYIGPRCNSGNQVSIGLFYDEDCWEPIEGVDVEELLGAKLSYHLLAQSYYANERVCLSCQEMNNNDNDEDNQDGGQDEDGNDAQDADDVNEMCENLYTEAAKCESQTGLENGFIQMNREDGDYENQVENEFMACNFIDSLVWNSYTQSGEINVGEPQDEIIRYVTQNQKFSLSFLAAFIVSLLGLMEYYRRKIASTGTQLHLTTPSAHSVLT